MTQEAGRTSVEVGVRVVAERWDEAGQEPRHVAGAYLVCVALDEQGQPRQVPLVVPETPGERRRVREAEIRRSARLARREQILRLRAARDDL